MKNRKLLLIISVVLALTLSLGGTLAYLTDTDSDVNVMTLGNVDIEQWENGEVDGFEQGQPLYPAYYETVWEDADENTGSIKKEVNVKNVGSSDAYIRTVFAIEIGDLTKEQFDANIHLDWEINTESLEWVDGAVQIEDGKYLIATYTYPEAVKAGAIAGVTLKRVVMDKEATNDIVSKLGNTYEILVVTQAAQTANLDSIGSAKDALNEAFYEITATQHPWAGEGDVVPELPTTVVTTVAEMVEVCKNGGNMILGNDIVYTAENTEEMIAGSIFLINGKNVTLDLNGHSITVEEDATNIYGAIFFTGNPGGHINIVGDGDIDVRNGLATVVWVLQSGTANIYGGNYISNSVSNEAMIYSQGNGGVINVYGGKYTYDLDRHLNGGFNVSDQAGNALRIVIHEGVLLSRPEYSQHLQGTNNGEQNRIQLAEGCALEEVTIDGETWYKVVKQ